MDVESCFELFFKITSGIIVKKVNEADEFAPVIFLLIGGKLQSLVVIRAWICPQPI
jgi:hypothetical protein